MAKTSIIVREAKRAKTVERFVKKRADIKEALRLAYKADKEGDDNATDRVMDLQGKLAALPRNSCPTRGRRRCRETGRPRGVYRKFGLGRTKLREYAMAGAVPGLTKASW